MGSSDCIVLAVMRMDATKSYVRTKEYCEALERYGFKYSSTTNSLFLSYPFVPKTFADEAVKITLSTPPLSELSKISSIEYYRRGSGYAKTDAPKAEFKSYADKLISQGLERARHQL